MKAEIELTESQAENLLNMVLSRADDAMAEDISHYNEEGRRNLREQVIAATILYRSIIEAWPEVAALASIRVFWEDGQKYQKFIKKLSEDGE
jgi:ribosomal silencing factor RsfS